MSAAPAAAKEAPCGSWRSPLAAARVAAGSLGLSQVLIDGGDVYWIEMRPQEGGRNVIVHMRDGERRDVVPSGYSARTRAHEYGGGTYAVAGDRVYFCNFADQRLYLRESDGAPQPLTPAADVRYADLTVDLGRRRLLAVREDHRSAGEPVNTLVSVPASGGEAEVLVSGADFYSSPCLSPDGGRLAWLAWNHPDMPWDASELWLAELDAAGTIGAPHRLAGGRGESIFQPSWSPDGLLHFSSDRSGWWNLYRWRDGQAEPLLPPTEAEFGAPQWVFGMSTYGFADAANIICTLARGGRWHLCRLDVAARRLLPLAVPWTEISSLRVAPELAVMCAGSPLEMTAVVRLDLRSGTHVTLCRSGEIDVEPGYLSVPRPMEFATGGGKTAHALFYAPRNRDFVAPAGERPPLLVKCHGGPTASASMALDLRIQYWTSRGIAVLDVNYGGSSGYGREYRLRLEGQWGVVDVDDCVNAALAVTAAGDGDAGRLMISGGSAGGYTALSALVFRDLFGAGASHYGISDLEGLVTDTHKFEARYLDRLVGPYPQQRFLYRERSPLHFTDRLDCPVIFFQGLDDLVVPPSQAEAMVAALRRKGLPVAYVTFAGEQHGFRRAATIRRVLEAELYFYSRVFGFPLTDALEPVAIENL